MGLQVCIPAFMTEYPYNAGALPCFKLFILENQKEDGNREHSKEDSNRQGILVDRSRIFFLPIKRKTNVLRPDP